MQTVKVGSRDSQLAVRQAELIMECLPVPCQLITMKTTGDLILDRTLDKVGGKGLFVKELDRALAAGEVDLTIHSLKDMPMEQPEDFPILAYSKRADVRDALVLAADCSTLDLTRPIGCSSARRRVQLKRLYPEAQIVPIRGNLQTRLAKLDSGAYGALVLAAAGLHRLGLQSRISKYFSVEEMLPAAGQGILAIQGSPKFAAWSQYFDDTARDCALAERAFVRTLNGGCSAPVAAYARVEGKYIYLSGMYVDETQTIVRFGNCSGLRSQAEEMGIKLAKELQEGAQR